MMADSSHIVYKGQNSFVANHKKYKRGRLSSELFSDTTNTNEFPIFHIPRKRVERANQVRSKNFDTDDILI